MHKKDFIRRVARETRLSRQVVGDVINATHRTIENALRDGHRVTFAGFETFYPSPQTERTIRHIQTGKPTTVPARTRAAFRAGEYLKRATDGQRRRG